MKRLTLFLIALFLCYIVYYDLQIGTLPSFSMAISEKTQAKTVENKESTAVPFYEVQVKQGDTVLSITEHYHGNLPTSIEKIIEDFEELNPDVKVETILLGEKYRFPDYKKKQE